MYYLQDSDHLYKYIYSDEQCINYCSKTGDIIGIKDNFFICKNFIAKEFILMLKILIIDVKIINLLFN